MTAINHTLKGKLAGIAMTAGSDEDLYTTGAPWNVE